MHVMRSMTKALRLLSCASSDWWNALQCLEICMQSEHLNLKGRLEISVNWMWGILRFRRMLRGECSLISSGKWRKIFEEESEMSSDSKLHVKCASHIVNVIWKLACC